ncbi:MAG: hypothetical protein EBT93_17395 [Alphaproteobacteria bacterium]|nr:hypothetical protein [Alphaproteobacteria bacterium]
MSKNKKPSLELSTIEANAIMVMLETEIESYFDYDFNPVSEWETIHHAAHRLLAYQKFKQWYMETHND